MTAAAVVIAEPAVAPPAVGGVRRRPRPSAPGPDVSEVGEWWPGASPVLAEWMSWWITGLDDVARSDLARRYAERFRRSQGAPGQEDRRRWLVADWLVRSCATRWLHEAQLHPHADGLADSQELRRVEDLAAIASWTRTARRAVRVQRQTVHDIAHSRLRWTAPGVWSTLPQAVAAAVGAAAFPLVRSAIRAGVEVSDGWRPVADAIVDAAASVAWRAIAQAGVADGDDPLAVAGAALARPAAELHTSAHHLVDRLLAVTEAPGPPMREPAP